jgi:8-oxo-dGTP pyrophosphatase MutT (NUDIX family)
LILPSFSRLQKQKESEWLLVKKRTSERRKSKSRRQVQYAALPYRPKGKSKLEIMLVTSRGTRRWIIPKGWPKRGMPPYETAAKEAFEEAGVLGKVSKRSIGSYPYDKILEKGRTASCRVQVFALRVTSQHKRWPEKRERRIRWCPPVDAMHFIREPHLRRIIRNFVKRR